VRSATNSAYRAKFGDGFHHFDASARKSPEQQADARAPITQQRSSRVRVREPAHRGRVVCLLLWGFLALASEVMEGDTNSLDTRILVALRKSDDPSRPNRPVVGRNLAARLDGDGRTDLLGLVVVSVVGFLLLQTRYHTAVVVLATAASGEVANYAMKNLFLRPRPDVVPHLRDVTTTSFPSGHAMESAIIYLTLGAMLMRLAERRITKMYCIGIRSS